MDLLRVYLPIVLIMTAATPISGVNVVCQQATNIEVCAWVSNSTPAQNSEVTVYGRLLLGGSGQPGQTMLATWRYKTTSPTCSGITDGNGRASCTRHIGRATVGYRVDIEVIIAGHTAVTWFMPQ